MFLLGFPASVLLGAAIRILLRPLAKKKGEDEKDDHEKEKDKEPPPSPLRLFVAVLFLLISSFFISLVIANYIQLSTISSFKQHIRIVAPYISDNEEEKLISEWSLINSKDDYQKIYNKLNKIATENGLQLPENKIYSMLSL